MKTLHALTALALALAAPALLAQTSSSGSTKPSWHKEFKAADTNNDDGLSRDEIKAAKAAKKGDFSIIEKYFDEMDANHDGKVTIDERTAWGKAHPNAIKSAKAKEKNK
jgi:beta-glucanase (GH16 family)